MLIQWRDFLIGEIQDKLRKNHNFFEANAATYENSPLKRIIARFEYILNTYLREFVRLSITDWVEFIRSFTIPSLEKNELWKVQPTPLLVIHLGFQMKSKKEDKKKAKKGAKGQKGAPGADETDQNPEDDQNRIHFQPRIEKCAEFLKSAITMIVHSTNKVCNLEDDLMPFL